MGIVSFALRFPHTFYVFAAFCALTALTTSPGEAWWRHSMA